MTDHEYARKLDELDRLLNDPDVPMDPSRVLVASRRSVAPRGPLPRQPRGASVHRRSTDRQAGGVTGPRAGETACPGPYDPVMRRRGTGADAAVVRGAAGFPWSARNPEPPECPRPLDRPAGGFTRGHPAANRSTARRLASAPQHRGDGIRPGDRADAGFRISARRYKRYRLTPAPAHGSIGVDPTLSAGFSGVIGANFGFSAPPIAPNLTGGSFCCRRARSGRRVRLRSVAPVVMPARCSIQFTFGRAIARWSCFRTRT